MNTELAQRVYSPFVGRDYPDQVLFGDTHFYDSVELLAPRISPFSVSCTEASVAYNFL
jgi:hypothetical protein